MIVNALSSKSTHSDVSSKWFFAGLLASLILLTFHDQDLENNDNKKDAVVETSMEEGIELNSPQETDGEFLSFLHYISCFELDLSIYQSCQAGL